MGARSLQILLVEDNDLVREVLGMSLGDLGHHVREARDGREALAYLAAEEARALELVITDRQMPGALGEEVVRAAKCLGCKAILMSGDTPAVVQQVAMAAGADRILLKPLELKGLEQAIAELFP